MKSWDIIISGAGIIGVSLALELHEQGERVLVLDSGEPGREASSAAAGMLAPADPETPQALRRLAHASALLFPKYIKKIEAAAEMQVDFRRQGAIALLEDASAPPEYEQLSSTDLHQLEPSLKSHGHPAFFVQEDSVDPRLLMQAALAAARRLQLEKPGIEVRGHAAVKDVWVSSGKLEISSEAGSFTARSFINCQGAWSGAPVKPRKGQMLYIQPQASILQHVLRTPDVYIVPRSSGKILIGATVEDVGFDKSVSSPTIEDLRNTAAKYLPELASAPITESWAGLRPGTPDDLPILGQTDTPNVFIASGHFRNGILLAPITATMMADLLVNGMTSYNLSAFSPSRFATAKT